MEYMTIGEAAEFLEMDRRTIARMIDRGELEAIPNPVDARSKIVRRVDVERLSQFPRPSKKVAA